MTRRGRSRKEKRRGEEGGKKKRIENQMELSCRLLSVAVVAKEYAYSGLHLLNL